MTPRSQAIASMLVEGLSNPDFKLRVEGHCMKDALVSGEEVQIIRRLPWPGDIVVVVDKDARILSHRYIGPGYKDGLKIVTKPDDAQSTDAMLPWSHYVGCVVVDVPTKARMKAAAAYLKRSLAFGRRVLKSQLSP